jgi:hypothetical protein
MGDLERYTVNPRGRIAKEVMEAFNAGQGMYMNPANGNHHGESSAK